MDDNRPLESDASGEQPGEVAAAPMDPRAWSNLWQVPTILVSLLLIALAVRVAMDRAPVDEFEIALVEVERLLDAGLIDPAGDILRNVLEPHIDRAESHEQGRFHAAVADWISQVQRGERVDMSANNIAIDRNYDLAVKRNVTLSAPRLERWIDALISLGRLNDAREKLAQLEEMDAGQPGLRTRRIELLRRIITTAMARREVPRDQINAWLLDYRNNRNSTVNDQLWAVARQAEMRFDAGEVRRAVDQLLIDMRRVEYAAEPGERLDLAEVFTLLGRGSHLLGDDIQALRYIDDALEILNSFGRTTDPARGVALNLAGRIAIAHGDFELAFQHFDTVVRDFVDTRSQLPALLGRAETSSILGSHEDAREDYRRLATLLAEGAPHLEITPRRIAGSLIDRHDASLAMGQLELAREYVLIAERFFTASSVPTDVLFRIATTSRQIAENKLARAGGIEVAGPTERHAANLLFESAAKYFIRHARMVTGLPTTDEDWADSLWQAADCYDLAGRHELAIQHFEEYLAGRSVADPRRADVTFRLAQCHHALQQYDSAAIAYEQVIREHPRSVTATRSHVPLARCYLALDRRPEAEQQLRQVLAGLHPVQRDAVDYRDAMIELGTIYYNAGRYLAAIEHLHQAAERYPEDARHTTVLFRLADSYRSEAMLLAERIREPSAESPGERRRIDLLRREHLRTALELFERVAAALDSSPQDSLNELQLDLMRSAYIHRADCAFHLGNFERAIVLYDEAARRFSDHHSSMHALIQIVNCYSELGDEGRAAAAHRRALVRLRQLRDDAFDAPDSLMDRQAWERWLNNTPVVPARSANAASS